MYNKNQKTTPKTIKTLLFAGIIVAMILPFSSIGMAGAVTQNNDKSQKKIDKLEEKLQKIVQKITKVKNIISQLEENLQKAQSNGDEDRIKKLKKESTKNHYILLN